MSAILENLFTAADNHAEDAGEPDHAVGDLQDLLREVWKVLTPSQKVAFLESDTVANNLETGARDEFDVDTLLEIFDEEQEAMEASITEAGYRIMECPEGFFWETDEFEGLTMVDRIDAVHDAFVDMHTPD